MRIRTIVAAGVTTVAVLAVTAAPGFAAPDGAPNYGTMEPASDGCPWPDEANESPDHADAQKCLPKAIPWSGNFHPATATDPTYGVRIISDFLVGINGEDAVGQVTFRCQSRVGLQYKVTVQELDPRTSYTVRALQFGFGFRNLGTITTDTRGNGILNGTLHLDGTREGVSGYGFQFFIVNSSNMPVMALAPEPAEPPATGMVPGVVGISVLNQPASPEYRAVPVG